MEQQSELLTLGDLDPYPPNLTRQASPPPNVRRAIKRRTDVVGTFPNPAALLRLAGHVLIEQHDEWDGAGRRYFSEHSMKLLNTHDEEVAIPELNAA